jgi:hypothetical protein
MTVAKRPSNSPRRHEGAEARADIFVFFVPSWFCCAAAPREIAHRLTASL